jgi:hypothetical protein
LEAWWRSAIDRSRSKIADTAEWRTWIGHRQPAISHAVAEALTFFKEIERN